MEEASGGWGQGLRRALAGVTGCLLVVCIVGSLVGGEQEPRTELAWGEGGGAGEELTGQKALQVNGMLEGADTTLKKLNKAQADQDKINEKLSGIISGIQHDLDSSMRAARAASAGLERNLTALNSEAVASALQRVNASVYEHAHSTEHRLTSFSTSSLSHIADMAQGFTRRFGELRSRVIGDRQAGEHERTKADEQNKALDLAVRGYEVLTQGRLGELLQRIEQLRAQLRIALETGQGGLREQDSDVSGALASALKGARSSTEGGTRDTRTFVVREVEEQMKALGDSIEGLKARSKTSEEAARQGIEQVQATHTAQSTALSDKATEIRYDAASVAKAVDDKARELQGIVQSMKADIQRSKEALKDEHVASIKEIQDKAKEGVNELGKMLDTKVDKYRGLAKDVKGMLTRALDLEYKSKSWNHARQDREVIALTGQYAKAEEGVSALERVVYTIDAAQVKEEGHVAPPKAVQAPADGARAPTAPASAAAAA